MDSEQRQRIVTGLASAMRLIDDGPYDSRNDYGGRNYFQLGRAWGIYEGLLRLLPKVEQDALLSEARTLAETMTKEEASQAYLDTNQLMSEAFHAYIDGFWGED